MGFTKRFINKELILSTRKNGEKVSGLFLKADMVVCNDTFSYEVYNMFLGGSSEEELKTKVKSFVHVE